MKKGVWLGSRGLFFCSWICLGLGCTSSGNTTSLNVGGAVDATNVDLSTSNCSSALTDIYSVYNSSNTTNTVRYATAAAYGCSANVKPLTNLSDLISFSSDSATAFLFEFTAKEFPSTSSPDDKRPQAAEYATDAVQSIIYNGTILVSADEINSTTNNPGSLLYEDRLSDANSYLTFVSMALMGALENRYASPYSNNYYHKANSLPWSTAATAIGDGCAYASAVLNFFDGINYIESATTSTRAASVYTAIEEIEPQIQYGCCLGLQTCGFSVSCGTSVTCTTGGSTCSTCTSCTNCPSLCTSCPTTLRSRANCLGTTSDENSCAAAGMVSQINNVLWSGPP